MRIWSAKSLVFFVGRRILRRLKNTGELMGNGKIPGHQIVVQEMQVVVEIDLSQKRGAIFRGIEI